MKTTTITVAERDATLTKLSLVQLGEVINEIPNLPQEMREQVLNFDNTPNAELLAALPMFVAQGLPYLSRIVAKAANSEQITEEVLLKECGADDIILLVDTWLELNNASFIIERIKKMQALYAPKRAKVQPMQDMGGSRQA